MPIENVHDPADRVLRLMAEASGLRQATCPWRAMLDPYVQSVLAAYRWHLKGALAVKYPNAPAALIRGIEVYESALHAVENHDRRKDLERIKRENEEAAAAAGGSGLHGPPRHRRQRT